MLIELIRSRKSANKVREFVLYCQSTNELVIKRLTHSNNMASNNVLVEGSVLKRSLVENLFSSENLKALNEKELASLADLSANKPNSELIFHSQIFFFFKDFIRFQIQIKQMQK